MKRILLAVMVAGGLAFGAPEARAQVAIGAQVSYAEDMDLGVGARAGVSLPFTGLGVMASFDYFFPGIDDFSYMELNANLLYDLTLVRVPIFSPYVGAGLNVARSSFDGASSSTKTEEGLNLVAGAEFGVALLKPFVEFRYQVREGGQFVVAAGLNF